MTSPILDSWHYHSRQHSSSIILPDGCQDLIFQQIAGECPRWFVSPLYNAPKVLNSEANCLMFGYRLQPGTAIDEDSLLSSLGCVHPETAQVTSRLETFTSRTQGVSDMLGCLAQERMSVKAAATELGLHMRSLQRHILKQTGRTASYWMRLARVRRAARELITDKALMEIAHQCGFSDQSHMTREFQHWLGHTPQTVRHTPTMLENLANDGYG